MDILLGVELILVVIAGLLVMAVTTPSAPLRPRRRNSGTKQPGKLMRAVAAAALLACLSAGAAASQQLPATPSPHWKVKYLGGEPLGKVKRRWPLREAFAGTDDSRR